MLFTGTCTYWDWLLPMSPTLIRSGVRTSYSCIELCLSPYARRLLTNSYGIQFSDMMSGCCCYCCAYSDAIWMGRTLAHPGDRHVHLMLRRPTYYVLRMLDVHLKLTLSLCAALCRFIDTSLSHHHSWITRGTYSETPTVPPLSNDVIRHQNHS